MTDDDDDFLESFLDLPVTGGFPNYDPRYVQPRPLSELAPLFQAVLGDEGITEFGWQQADPEDDPFDGYVSKVWFRTATDAGGHPLAGHPAIGPGERYDRCAALEKALKARSFDDVLREGLGEWCDVRVSRAVITVTWPTD